MEAASGSCNVGAPEIVFFDLETTVPHRVGDRFRVLEFGAIVICPMKLVELESFSTLIRPTDLSAVGSRSSRPEGITRERVADAPLFEEVADKIFSMLDGRVWGGHNIQRFDCVRIREVFAEIGKPPPVPIGMVDSLGVLTAKFGKRAGDMKMASLASYFQLGQQKHRSLDDVRMNLEVLKHCATVLFLESTLPTILHGKWKSGSSSSMTTRNRANVKFQCRGEGGRRSPPTSEKVKNVLCRAQGKQQLNVIFKHSRSLLR